MLSSNNIIHRGWKFPCQSQILPYRRRVKSGINTGISNPNSPDYTRQRAPSGPPVAGCRISSGQNNIYRIPGIICISRPLIYSKAMTTSGLRRPTNGRLSYIFCMYLLPIGIQYNAVAFYCLHHVKSCRAKCCIYAT